MGVPRLGVQLELQPPATATATAMLDQSLIWDLHHSSQQCQIPNPLSEARGRTHVLMDTSWIRFCCATTGTPNLFFNLNLPFSYINYYYCCCCCCYYYSWQFMFFKELPIGFFFFYFLVFFLGPHPWHMEVPRLGV